MPRKSKFTKKSKSPRFAVILWGVPKGNCGACDYGDREGKKARDKDTTYKKKIIKCSKTSCSIPGKKNITSVPYTDIKDNKTGKTLRISGALSAKEIRKVQKSMKKEM